MKAGIFSLAACCLLAAPALAADDKVTADDLKRIGLAYHNYFEKNKKGPAKAEDLEPYAALGDKKEEAKRLVELLKSEKIKFIYNVGIFDMVDGTSNTVIGYEKDIAKSGGLALYGDASVRKLSADEFKKVTLAKPKSK